MAMLKLKAKRVKNFEEACKHQGLNPKKVLPDVSMMLEQDRKAIIALAKMCIIQRSLNGEWATDWADRNQHKYYPWFYVSPEQGKTCGFGLSFFDIDVVYGVTCAMARLFYRDRSTAQYAGETFVGLYEDMILVPPKAARKEKAPVKKVAKKVVKKK